MNLRDKLSLHEISKRTGLSRNTLRKWLRKPAAEVVAPPCYARGSAPNKLTPYHATIEQALKADAHRTKENRRTSKVPTDPRKNSVQGTARPLARARRVRTRVRTSRAPYSTAPW